MPVKLMGFLLTSLLWSSPLSAAVPHLIRYQGQVADSQDVPLEGPYDLTFRLYDAETGGTQVWEEVQPNVALTAGHFTVLLGQVTPLTVDWSQPCWLSIQVGTEPELSPRQRITSVPLAIRAESAERAQTAGRAERADVAEVATDLANPQSILGPITVTDRKVGIGTTAPQTPLEVVGGPIKATGGLIIETRTSDPSNPTAGQLWLRSDVQ